ncbi:uncharacterized protein [Rhodnius prolixus]|uniref:Uncharacterized protein n=1 Tax=Rhodnius prolixus TaxID=13249 RepID=T1HKM0_RHOPR
MNKNSAIVTFNGINAQIRLCPNTGFVRQVYYNEKSSQVSTGNHLVQMDGNFWKPKKSMKYNENPDKIRREECKHPLRTCRVSRLGFYLGYQQPVSYRPRIQNSYAEHDGLDKIKQFSFDTLPPGDKLEASKIRIVHGMRKSGINFAEYVKNNVTTATSNVVV